MEFKYDFLQDEPEDLKNLNLDYKEQEFTQVMIYQVDIQSKEKQLLFDGFIWLIETFLVIKIENLEQNVEQQDDTLLQWIDINQWLVKFITVDPTVDDQEITISILQHDECQHEIQIIFTNVMDFISIKPLFQQICTIMEPQLETEFDIKRKLGQGAQASVILYQSKNEVNIQQVAVKIFKLRANTTYKNLPYDIKNEITFLRELKICSNISQLDRVYYDGRTIKLVMRFAKYGTLMKFLEEQRKFTEEQIRTIMEQLILAVDLMHRKNIIHRDIKPDNILLDDRDNLQICISDLGLACRADDASQVKLKCGTPGYVGPEILKGSHSFTIKSDVFSVGCVFYKIITGKNLFQGKGLKDLLLSNKFQNPFSIITLNVNGVSNECKDLLQWMVQTNPDARPSAEECINHKWFQKDRVALQNSLMINKNNMILATLLFKPYESNQADFTSFCVAPNYFEHMYSNFSHLSNHSGTPKGSVHSPFSSKGRSPSNFAGASKGAQLRMNFCYNKIISQGRLSSGSRQLDGEEEDKQDSINKPRLPRLESSPYLVDANQINNSSMNVKRVHPQLSNMEVLQPQIKLDMDSPCVQADFIDKMLQEYSPTARNDNNSGINTIEFKYSHRTQIADVNNNEKSMYSRNQTAIRQKRIFLN